jgi:Zn-dependent protease with chaperone function
LTSHSDSPGEVPGVAASYYDGRHSTRHAVFVTIGGGTIAVIGDGIERREPLAAVQITEAIATSPRLVRFADGASCEIDGTAAFAAMLTREGVASGRLTQWEGSLRWIAAAVAVFLVILAAGYRYVLPSVANVAAAQVPDVVVDAICSQVMTVLDGSVFDASQVSNDVQWRLTSEFKQLSLPGTTADSLQLMFRKSEQLGPNAVAIPSGEIVVTDELVTLARADEEVLAVLAHEAGHIARRHGLRQLFQDSVLSLVLTWFLGDVSVLAAAAPTAILQAKYSRDFEREADEYALEALQANGVSREHFANVLERIETTVGLKGDSGLAVGYLSSHPVTSERVARVRGKS